MNKQQAQSQKPKNSRLAISALVIPVVMWGSGICILGARGSFSRNIAPNGLDFIMDLSATAMVLLSGVVGIILGALALILIKESKGALKGKRFAIEGITVAIGMELVFFTFLFFIVAIKGR